MKKNHKNQKIQIGWESPLDELLDDYYDEVIVDVSEGITTSDDPIRVELRKMKKPIGNGVPQPENSYIIGIIDLSKLPKEGEEFVMPYHFFNEFFDLGKVSSKEPIYDVKHIGSEEEDCYYFSTSEGDWRLKVLDKGN